MMEASVTHTYRYDGYKILTYASGKKGVRYLFTATDSQAADNLPICPIFRSSNRSNNFKVNISIFSSEIVAKMRF